MTVWQAGPGRSVALARIGAALVLGVGLAACSTELERSGQDAPTVGPVPRPVQAVTGEPGAPVTLTYDAAAGEAVQVTVSPWPEQDCASDLVLSGPDGEDVELSTLDPWSRLNTEGEWSWTFTPCEEAEAAFTITPAQTRSHALTLAGEPLDLRDHGTYVDAATFVVPAAGRAVLSGEWDAVLGPDGTAVAVFDDDRLVFDDGELRNETLDTASGDQEALTRTWTVVGSGGPVRLARPTEVHGSVGSGRVELEAPTDGAVEYAVEFSVSDDTWLTAPREGWAAVGASFFPDVVVEPADGETDVSRQGGGFDGLWHLTPGAYVARVEARSDDDSGSIELVEVTPTTVDGRGTFTMTTAADGTPSVMTYDLEGDHVISVAEATSASQPWALTWSPDEPRGHCASVLSCTADHAPTIPNVFGATEGPITGSGYLALASHDGKPQAVTVTIRRAQ